ncbi:MAG TPA: host attachment protein [Dissulfurispiraceae bacterium]|nr:host attachment protein [Dissulfurispiraceae bacterium]
MGKMVFVVDLGHFKAYRLSKTEQATPRLELIDSFDLVSAHGKMSDKVTDGPGKFGGQGGGGWSAKGYGEPHEIANEEQKRQIKALGQAITASVRQENADSWYLAAERSILKQLVEALDQDVISKLVKQVAANLTKAGKSEIIKRFV